MFTEQKIREYLFDSLTNGWPGSIMLFFENSWDPWISPATSAVKVSPVYPRLPPFTNRLVHQAQRGSADAADQLYPLIGDLFRYHARRLVHGLRSAILDEFDVTQEALMKVVRHLSKYHGDSTGEFASWLRSILRSTLLDILRDRHFTEKSLSFEDVRLPFRSRLNCSGQKESPEAEAIRNEEETLVFASALFLPEPDCDVVLLRFQGEDFKEIGRRLHCSSDAARMRFHRSIDEIRLFWKDED